MLDSLTDHLSRARSMMALLCPQYKSNKRTQAERERVCERVQCTEFRSVQMALAVVTEWEMRALETALCHSVH